MMHGPINISLVVLKFRKIRPVGAKLVHADGHRDVETDRHVEGNFRFNRFSERALKLILVYFIPHLKFNIIRPIDLFFPPETRQQSTLNLLFLSWMLVGMEFLSKTQRSLTRILLTWRIW